MERVTGIGHNKGPSMAPGQGWQRHAWSRARAALIPNTMPLEIVRLRVKRAAALGLDYRTYASIRAASGHDVIAFLISGNTLELRPGRAGVPIHVAKRLSDLRDVARRAAAIYEPMQRAAVLRENAALFEHVGAAPDFAAPWSVQRERVGQAVRALSAPPDGVVLIAATAVEREWCAAGRLAGVIPAERFFAVA